MKFAHIADVHLGSWREPVMRELNTRSFTTCIDRCVSEKVDFLLVAGDLFNTSMPAVDAIKVAAQKFRELKELGIPVYLIAGSHDFSPSGKTMLDVLEEAGLCTNVVKGDAVDGKLRLKFTVDPKTGAKITGLLGRRGGLDRQYYDELLREPLENETGFKIFMFHCTINELKPKEFSDVEGMSVSFLPKNFQYYAGGHVHITDHMKLDDRSIVYPGPVFPNSFSEIEKLKQGSFVICDNGTVTHIPLALQPVVSIFIDANGKTPVTVEEALRKELDRPLENAIVTVRVSGTLANGKPSDINMQDILASASRKNPFFIMRNINVESKEFTAVTIAQTAEDIERALIDEHVGKSAFSVDEEKRLVASLLRSLRFERDEGEKVSDYEKRVISDAQKIFS